VTAFELMMTGMILAVGLAADMAGPPAGVPLPAQGLNKFGRLDGETCNHDPKRGIDFYRDNQLGLNFISWDRAQP
jgi:hypothetical protein